MHEGPLYTVLGDHYRGGNQADPFESMPTYTNKYRKKTRKIPKLDTRPYGKEPVAIVVHVHVSTAAYGQGFNAVLDFFPEELWTTLDSSLEKKVGQSSGVSSRKTLQLSRQRLASELLHEGISGGGGGATAASLRDNANEDGEDQPEEGNEKVDKNDDEMLDRDNGDRDEDDEEEEGEEEEVDDNFEDDEDDMGEDYNAQQHYEEGDEVDDYDAGGGDGGGDDGWM